MVMRSSGPKRDAEAELKLPPGFRFHPTDDELVLHYLCRKVSSRRLPVPIIADVDLYKFDPWDLPEMALFGQKEWYFFTPRDRKYPNGSRPNRAAGRGYWKATGADKPVRTDAPTGQPLGIKKALVFYHGKAPRGVKTDWIMHEYRLVNDSAGRAPAHKGSNLRLDDWVLCRLYNKKNRWNKQPSAGEATASHAEHGDFAAQAPWKVGGNNMFDEQMMATSSVQKQEESEWFTDLITLDNVQGSLTGIGFGSMPTTTHMGGPIQDYNFFLGPGYK